MIPGTTTKLSISPRRPLPASGILHATHDIMMVDAPGPPIWKIIPHFGGGFSGFMVLVPSAGTVVLEGYATHPGGNIEGGGSLGGAMTMVWLHTLGVWVLGRPAS